MTACTLQPVEQIDSTLINWLKSRLANKKIPFALFNFSDTPDWSDCETVEVAGLQIPKLGELTTIERIVLDNVADNQIESSTRLQLTLRQLAKALATYWNTICEQVDFNTPEEKNAVKTLKALKPVQLSGYIFPADSIEYRLVSATVAYQEFQSEHLEEITQALNIAIEMQDGSFSNLMRIAFFLASRLGSAWLNPVKLQRLTESKAQALLDFVALESNNGEDIPDIKKADGDAKETEGK
jgi:hypothetical protein